jgi:hypothetical protein
MKDFLQTISRLYNGKIIIAFILVFFIIQIPLFQIIPDFFNLYKIESAESYILKLLSIVIGFSSFILTILLVIYNSFSKKIRRNSFDFILDNPWIKFTFTLFCGSLIFISLSVFFVYISSINTIITLLYLSSFVTFGNLFIQFPLIILSIKHSNSFDTIKELINKIDDNDTDNLFNPTNKDDVYLIEHLEKNRIIQLKDIGISAIKDNDWGLPQTILNDLYFKFIDKLDKNTQDKKLYHNIYAYSFIIRHFKKIALEESDDITINVILHNLLRIHSHFAKNEIRDIRNNPIDENIKDLIRLLIENNSFHNLQPYLLTKLEAIIGEHINSMKYSDVEVPTSDYIFSQKNFDYQVGDKKAKNYWFYIKNELPDIYFKALEHSIEKNNKNVYSYFNWKLHSLLDKITNSKTLTESQENEIFQQYSYKARQITDFAIQHKIYRNIEFYSIHQIENWLEKDKKYGFNALYDLSYLLKKLNKVKNLYNDHIDDYFMIARRISTNKNFNIDTKLRVLKIIVDDGFNVLNDENSEKYVKDEIIKQLKWINGYFETEKDLKELNEEYAIIINEL